MKWAERIAAQLLAATTASRTTVRILDYQDQLQLVAEVCASGVGSMGDGPQIDPRQFATYRYLEQRRELLVQDDCRDTDIAPPPSLVDYHGVASQMLAPIVVHDRFRGTISVHHQGQPRHWSAEEITALEDARHDAETTMAYPENTVDDH